MFSSTGEIDVGLEFGFEVGVALLFAEEGEDAVDGFARSCSLERCLGQPWRGRGPSRRRGGASRRRLSPIASGRRG